MKNNSQKDISEDVGVNPFYMVVRLGSDGLQQMDASPTRRYDCVLEASQEAKRLASKHPTHPRGFAVVQAICVYKAEVIIKENQLMGTYNVPSFNDSSYQNVALLRKKEAREF
jgi:hypothetical protein